MHTHRAYPRTHFHADKTLSTLVQWCVTGRVQPLFRWHGCCDRSQGKHLPHRTVHERQQSGRCRRCCTCRSFAGNDFDVQEVCVQGACSVSPQMLLHGVVCRVGVVNLWCSMRCGFCDIVCGSNGKVYSFLCRGNCARFVLKLMWHSVRSKLD